MQKRIIIASFLCLVSFGITYAQSRLISKADSTLYYSYLKRLSDVTNPEVPLVADTLFDLAAKTNNVQVQSMAIGSKLSYYYYKSGEISTEHFVDLAQKVMSFAKANKLSDLYYFTWGSRLINHYLGLGEYNIALVEAEKMLKEAEAEEYTQGIADCYFCMSNIYTAKQLNDKALEYMLKQIDLFEKYDLKTGYISLQYSDAAKIYLDKGEKDKTHELLEKALKHSSNAYHEATAKLVYVWLYMNEDNLAQAGETLEECRRLYTENRPLKRHIHYLYQVEVAYYRKIRHFNEALRILDLREQELKQRNQTITITSLLETRADIYWEMGRKEEAAALYRQYIEAHQKILEKQEEMTSSEFATLLDIQRLNAENAELAQISQQKQLMSSRIVLFFLLLLLVMVFAFFYYQRKLNKKLKKSRDILDEKNQTLIEAEKELVKAKDLAEKNNEMKTLFIQNMSHEIRTPLNSIVGFSSVLMDCFPEENEDVRLYFSLIEKNSNLLLKLINDILDISVLDDTIEEIELAPVDINDCCAICISEARPNLPEGVNLFFKPAGETLMINSNGERLVQVLRNLLNNAIKFTTKGSITLSYQVNKQDNRLDITVTDTGIGISEEFVDKVFERFVKQDDFTQGAGLGLPISRLIAERLGGSLIIDKAYTSGARFVFSIPMDSAGE